MFSAYFCIRTFFLYAQQILNYKIMKKMSTKFSIVNNIE